MSVQNTVQNITLETLSEVARRTTETPPRVSVYDVIAAAKDCDGDRAGQIFRRLLSTGTVPECAEVPHSLIQGLDQKSRGGARKPVVVATAKEMVQILWALPGDTTFRRNCADICVRYLGGDETLVGEVFENRAAQEQLAAAGSLHPARFFGEAVEHSRSTGYPCDEGLLRTQVAAIIDDQMDELVRKCCTDAEPRLMESMRKEWQRTHPWDFQKHTSQRNSLVDIGVVVEGEELTELDEDEHVVRIVDWLKERLTADTWKKHGNKLKNIFAIELKKHKIEQHEADGQPLLIARNQGEFRIIYTEADGELMTIVFNKCKRRFNSIATRDEALLKSRQKQRRIEDYFIAAAAGHDEACEDQGIIGNHATSAAVDETGMCNAPTSTSLVHSEDRQCCWRRGGTVVMHRDAVVEAPASLRVAAKRGDVDINIKG